MLCAELQVVFIVFCCVQEKKFRMPENRTLSFWAGTIGIPESQQIKLSNSPIAGDLTIPGVCFTDYQINLEK